MTSIHTNHPVYLFPSTDRRDEKKANKMPEVLTSEGPIAADEPDLSIFENKSGLAEDLKFLASMPELCDVTFLVGETREPVCAVKVKEVTILLSCFCFTTSYVVVTVEKGVVRIRRNRELKNDFNNFWLS